MGVMRAMGMATGQRGRRWRGAGVGRERVWMRGVAERGRRVGRGPWMGAWWHRRSQGRRRRAVGGCWECERGLVGV